MPPCPAIAIFLMESVVMLIRILTLLVISTIRATSLNCQEYYRTCHAGTVDQGKSDLTPSYCPRSAAAPDGSLFRGEVGELHREGSPALCDAPRAVEYPNIFSSGASARMCSIAGRESRLLMSPSPAGQVAHHLSDELLRTHHVDDHDRFEQISDPLSCRPRRSPWNPPPRRRTGWKSAGCRPASVSVTPISMAGYPYSAPEEKPR